MPGFLAFFIVDDAIAAQVRRRLGAGGVTGED